MGKANLANVLLIFSGLLVQVARVLPRSAIRLIMGRHRAVMDSIHSFG